MSEHARHEHCWHVHCVTSGIPDYGQRLSWYTEHSACCWCAAKREAHITSGDEHGPHASAFKPVSPERAKCWSIALAHKERWKATSSPEDYARFEAAMECVTALDEAAAKRTEGQP